MSRPYIILSLNSSILFLLFLFQKYKIKWRILKKVSNNGGNGQNIAVSKKAHRLSALYWPASRYMSRPFSRLARSLPKLLADTGFAVGAEKQSILLKCWKISGNVIRCQPVNVLRMKLCDYKGICAPLKWRMKTNENKIVGKIPPPPIWNPGSPVRG